VKARKLWAFVLAAACAPTYAFDARAASEPSAETIDVSALAVSDERLYVGSFDTGLYVVERGQALRAFADSAVDPHVNALAWSASERVLWVGTARGLARCPAGESCVRIGPEGNVHALAVSSDEVLVAGSDTGLTFIERAGGRAYGRKEGAPFRSVWSLASIDGRLFVGTTNGLFWGAPGAFTGKHPNLGRAAVVLNTLPDDWVTALAQRDGTLFVGTYNAGVAAFRSPTPLVPVALDTTLGYVNPAGITALGAECIAVATMDGLRLGAPGHTVPLATRARDVTAVVPDPHGGLWIGTRSGLDFRDESNACPAGSGPSD
jgi:ligand-binding sensor domain-containing protein